MSSLHEKCPFCPMEFNGREQPRCGGENAYLLCAAHVWLRHPTEMFTCPRQINGVQSFWRVDGTCSYCGSITPDAFFAAIEEGNALLPTDKNYKIYVGNIERKFKFNHLSQEQMVRFVGLHHQRELNMAEEYYRPPFIPFFMQKV